MAGSQGWMYVTLVCNAQSEVTVVVITCLILIFVYKLNKIFVVHEQFVIVVRVVVKVCLIECAPSCAPPVESVDFYFPTGCIFFVLQIARGFFHIKCRVVFTIRSLNTGDLVFREQVNEIYKFSLLDLLEEGPFY